MTDTLVEMIKTKVRMTYTLHQSSVKLVLILL